jgi:UDP-N-acetylmuramyl tripeptide synthase
LALDAAREKDTVLIAGKGHETFQEVQYTAIPFDDRKVAGELLSAKMLAL